MTGVQTCALPISAARERIGQLGLPNPTQAFNNLIIRDNQAGRASTLSALAHLAQDLGLPLSPAAVIPPTPIVETIIAPANATATPPSLAFRVAEKIALTCVDEPEIARLHFSVRDAQGRELPNIAIEIRSDTAEEVVVTGLKPEQGIGYADFDATAGKYSTRIQSAASESASDLVIGAPPANCKNDKGNTPRGWKIVFKQSR